MTNTLQVTFVERADLESEFEIEDRGSDYWVLDSIVPELKVSGRIALGIILDANGDPSSRWQAIAARLREADIEPPDGPASHGTIIESNPRVGVWLMPDNKSSGELENFVEGMIPLDDAVWPLSQDYINRIPEADRKFAVGKTTRAKVHAWLAARREPRKMGQAIRAGDLNTKTTDAQHFVSWLRNLFS